MSEDKELMNKIEAALFVSGRFLTVQEIVMLTGINPLLVKDMIVKLQEEYGSRHSAMILISQGEKWKMDVRNDYHDMMTKLASGKAEFTRAEQETLAIIAYKQPIKQSVIIKIRGNKAYDHIKRFIEYGLVKSKKFGHTLELQLSDKFYDYFQLGGAEEAIQTAEQTNES